MDTDNSQPMFYFGGGGDDDRSGYPDCGEISEPSLKGSCFEIECDLLLTLLRLRHRLCADTLPRSPELFSIAAGISAHSIGKWL